MLMRAGVVARRAGSPNGGNPRRAAAAADGTMSLDLEMVRKIQSVARQRHHEWSRRADDAPRGEPNTIGRVAAKLARTYYRGRFTGDSASREQVAQCAGNLVYAMACYGLSFEGVCDLSEIRVARVVSGLSPNITLPHGLRRQKEKSDLVLATVDSQIVRLAELYCAAQKVQQSYGPADLRIHAEALRRWADDAEELFDGLCKLRQSRDPGIQGVLAQTRDMIAWVGRAGVMPTPRTTAPAPAPAPPADELGPELAIEPAFVIEAELVIEPAPEAALGTAEAA